MQPKSKWPDFLMTVAIRFIGGALLGILLGSFFGLISLSGRRGGRRGKSFIVERINAEDYWPVILWIGGWALACGIVCLLTIPYWETPWYKGMYQGKGKGKETNPPDDESQ